jgi:outer membrane protein
MFRKTPICLILALLMGAITLSAQTPPKYGHMNLGNLLESMPETKTANDKLKVFADSLTAIDEKMTKSFQEAYKKLEEEYNAGLLTPVQAQTRQAELQKQQEDIQKFEQQAQQSIAAQRESLLKPILTRVEDAVKAVATENSYLMIFDTSSGAFLFAAEADDVTMLVKKKLGI